MNLIYHTFNSFWMLTVFQALASVSWKHRSVRPRHYPPEVQPSGHSSDHSITTHLAKPCADCKRKQWGGRWSQNCCPSMGCDGQAAKNLTQIHQEAERGNNRWVKWGWGWRPKWIYAIITVMEKLHATCALFYLFTKSTITFNSLFALPKDFKLT